MNGDDRGSGPEWPIKRRRDRIDTSKAAADGPRPAGKPRREHETRVETRRRGINPIYIALGGVVLLLLLLWLFFGRGNSDQDKLTGAESSNAAAADPEKLCGSNRTYDLIKRDLFRRAAQVRGSDQGAYDRLSAYASLRMENPVMESEDSDNGRVNCSGSLALDLPPGVAVVGGRRTLTANVDYTVQPAADGSGNVVLLRNADAIIAPLATLGRTGQPTEAPQEEEPSAGVDSLGQPLGNGPPPNPDPAPAPAPPRPAPAEEPPPPPSEPRETSSARPSYNCANARTRSEKAVCSNSGLASLDRQMAAQFNSAMSNADRGERALLERTRGRFLAFRERCGSDSCIADAYRGRMREIRDIMAGRWSPPR